MEAAVEGFSLSLGPAHSSQQVSLWRYILDTIDNRVDYSMTHDCFTFSERSTRGTIEFSFTCGATTALVGVERA